MSASLLWFRLDLRLDDNPALLAAVAAGAPVIPVFIWAPEEEEPWPPGAASRWWLHQSLTALDRRLRAAGSQLIVRRGPSLDALERLIEETGARRVFWNRRYEPALVRRDEQIKQRLAAESFNAALLFEPWTVRRYEVFTAYWKACMALPVPTAPQNAPKAMAAPAKWPKSLEIADLGLEPRIDWAAGIRAAWTPGEEGARAALKRFVRQRDYAAQRDYPAAVGTSRLSPHLHFGEISVRRVWGAIDDETFRRELGWREFAHHLLFHFPQTTNRPLRPEFEKFPWRNDQRLLKAWQRGQTGYLLVDAGMRELWTTGWMHNRVRMVASSFLTKHLRINWEEGAYWFWDTLVDADLANNTLGWQWTAGCGADAAPYFRIFNPERQAERFDPEGEYVRKWVPEMDRSDYPRPIVDHAAARQEALAAFEKMRGL
jgi:deoxyribodipyrimidine photo-lyase